MTERRRVSLNGTLYDIVGDVQRFLSSTPPQKVVFGDYTEENHPLTSTVSWNSFRRGMNRELFDPQDMERSRFTTLNVQHVGHMFPQQQGGAISKVVSSASPSGVLDGVAKYRGSSDVLYTASYSRTDSQGFIRRANHVSPGVVNFPVANVRAGHLWTGKLDNSATYLVAPLLGYDNSGDYSSGGIFWTHTSTNDTSFSYSSATKINYVAKWHDVLWGINGSGDLYFTSTLPTDGSTAVTWTKTANLDFGQSTDGVVEVKGLGVGPDNRMYAITQDGLHRYDNQNERFDHVFRLPNDSRGGLGWTVWQGSFFYSRGLEVWRWTPEGGFGQPPVAESMGLDVDEGPPYEYRGLITGLNHSLESLYAQTQVYDQNNQRATVFEWRQDNGWVMRAQSVNKDGVTSPMLTTGRGMYVGDGIGSSATADEQYLFSAVSHIDSGSTFTVAELYSVSQSSNGDRKLSPTEMDTNTLGFVASSAGNVTENQITTPWVQAEGKQSWNALSVEVRHSPINLSSQNSVSDTHQIILSYQKDFESSETTLGTIKGISDNSPGVTEFKFRSEGKEEGQPFSAMRLIAKWRNTDEIALDMNRLSLHFKKTYDPLWGYRFMIDTNVPQGPRSSRQIENDLVSLFSEKTLFPFSFHDDVSSTVREVNVTAISLEAEESPDYKNTGRYVVTVSEVQ